MTKHVVENDKGNVTLLSANRALTHGSNYSITFPIAFSNACVATVPYYANSATTTQQAAGYAYTYSKYSSGATFQWGWNMGGTGNADLCYVAFGY